MLGITGDHQGLLGNNLGLSGKDLEESGIVREESEIIHVICQDLLVTCWDLLVHRREYRGHVVNEMVERQQLAWCGALMLRSGATSTPTPSGEPL